MNLMIIVLMYCFTAIVIRAVLLAILFSKYPSTNSVRIITLIAFAWPIWPELAIYAGLALLIRLLIRYRAGG